MIVVANAHPETAAKQSGIRKFGFIGNAITFKKLIKHHRILSSLIFCYFSNIKTCLFPLFSLALALPVGATTIIETFEGSSAGSSTPPTNWSLVTVAGSPSYVTSATNEGSDGTGGSTGLAGEVNSDNFLDANLPGGYLTSSQVIDLNNSVHGTFDFFIVDNGGGFEDFAFVIGDIGTGFTGSTADELLSIKIAESGGGFGTKGTLSNGSGSSLDSTNTGLADNTWYTATFTWTPTSGITGDASITVNNFSSNVYTLSTTGFTFGSSSAQIGFGSVNDTIRFDNVNFVSIPEPSTLGLIGIAFGCLMMLKRRA